MKEKSFVFFMILGLIATSFGCAGSRIYLMDVRYIPERKAPPTSKLVGVCPFEDAREEKEKETIGIRHRPGNKIDLLKLEGITLSKSVTQAVKDYFAERGFEVTDCKGWDKSAEGLALLPEDLFLVVGGRIDSFKVEARSGITITDTHYMVKMDASIGQVEKRKMVIRTIESAPKSKKMGFDPDEVKAQLNGILTEVIQKLFEGKY
ncbi:MAG: hypothetical protein JSU78_02135 [Deltaproteobacteria bacterium]|nr:MAG: hypothetical protein JSU78_02135 [Deltaproteobacteria bacterium]